MSITVDFAALTDSLAPTPLQLSPERRAAYAHDESQFAPWVPPLAVVLARDVGDIQQTVRFAAENGLSVVPQGSRTGLSGGANGVEQCVALSMEDMSTIIEIDPLERIAVVEPGVVNAALSRAAAEHGLFYPPDPGSWELSTIGGNVATNAGGLCCVKYGVTGNYVRALQVVLASGEVIRTGQRTRKGVVGYDLTQLFVGSEGTLGVISEITVQLIAAPDIPGTVAAYFSSIDDAAHAVRDIVRAGLSPSMLELMDGTSLRAVDAMFHLDVPTDCAAMLITQHDGGPSDRERFIRDVTAIFAEHRAIDIASGQTTQENDALLTARRNVHFAGERLGAMLTDDVCVPIAALSALVDGTNRLADAAGLTVTFLGHAGDGNIHTTVIYERGSRGQAKRAHQLSMRIGRLALTLGGTVSGEHGIGNLKKEMMLAELGTTVVDLQRGIKSVLDPLGVLNPGKLFDRTDVVTAGTSACT